MYIIRHTKTKDFKETLQEDYAKIDAAVDTAGDKGSKTTAEELELLASVLRGIDDIGSDQATEAFLQNVNEITSDLTNLASAASAYTVVEEQYITPFKQQLDEIKTTQDAYETYFKSEKPNTLKYYKTIEIKTSQQNYKEERVFDENAWNRDARKYDSVLDNYEAQLDNMLARVNEIKAKITNAGNADIGEVGSAGTFNLKMPTFVPFNQSQIDDIINMVIGDDNTNVDEFVTANGENPDDAASSFDEQFNGTSTEDKSDERIKPVIRGVDSDKLVFDEKTNTWVYKSADGYTRYYDNQGRKMHVEHDDGREWNYNDWYENGQAKQCLYKNTSGETFTLSFDEQGRRTEAINQDGNKWNYTDWYQNGNVKQADFRSDSGEVYFQTYDENGKVTETKYVRDFSISEDLPLNYERLKSLSNTVKNKIGEQIKDEKHLHELIDGSAKTDPNWYREMMNIYIETHPIV